MRYVYSARPILFNYFRCKGVNLIELTIAMAIGAIILLGITSVYSSSKKANTVQNGLSRVQESGRFVLEFLTRDIRMAGYPQGAGPLAFNNATTNEGAAANSDQITLQYNQPTPLTADCNGNLVDPIINKYDIQLNANNVPGLFCNDIELIEGIDNLQILYGMDSDNIPDGIANTYVNADDVATQWARIVSVRIAVLANSVRETSNMRTRSAYTLLGTNVNGFNDNRNRRVFNATIMLRNNI
ncbi:MAG: PilW family protein [Gammaproteobacteria bacterium]